MGRRGNGEGSIYQRADGRWSAYVTLGYDGATGKQRRKYVYGHSRREAAEKLSKLMAKAGAGRLPSPAKISLSTWLQRHAEERGREVKARTRANYAHYLSKIPPELGELPLRRVQPIHIRTFYGTLGQLSPSVRKHIHDFLRQAFFDARRLELIEGNPMEVIDRPRGGRLSKPQVWEPGQARRFLGTARSHRLYAAFYLLLTAGPRIGEVLGLSWEDLTGDQLHIRRTVVTVDSKTLTNSPKTDRSARSIVLAPDLLAVLAAHRENQLEERSVAKRYADQGWMFASTVGTLTSYSNFRREYLKLVSRAGVPRIRIHDLRYTNITMSRDAGVDAEVVAERVGHDVKATMTIYSQVTEARRRKGALRLEDLYKVDS